MFTAFDQMELGRRCIGSWRLKTKTRHCTSAGQSAETPKGTTANVLAKANFTALTADTFPPTQTPATTGVFSCPPQPTIYPPQPAISRHLPGFLLSNNLRQFAENFSKCCRRIDNLTIL